MKPWIFKKWLPLVDYFLAGTNASAQICENTIYIIQNYYEEVK